MFKKCCITLSYNSTLYISSTLFFISIIYNLLL
nr:MAG TPA: hypothetical protein [Caudoviricetes sp.]